MRFPAVSNNIPLLNFVTQSTSEFIRRAPLPSFAWPQSSIDAIPPRELSPLENWLKNPTPKSSSNKSTPLILGKRKKSPLEEWLSKDPKKAKTTLTQSPSQERSQPDIPSDAQAHSLITPPIRTLFIIKCLLLS